MLVPTRRLTLEIMSTAPLAFVLVDGAFVL